METKVKTEVLNDLILINNDRIEGYRKATEQLKEGHDDLKTLFAGFIAQSEELKGALVAEVSALGEEVDEGTTNSGKVYRGWMDLKAAISGNERKTVLESCEFGEDAAQKAYETALRDEGISEHLRGLISGQKQDLRASHDKVKALRDAQT